ncbi:hypothetical protein M441DRAFT_78933 [Trichoderma asperellum CBS 433.97]|uniref:Major facilitator superfamily (MFS) profile domain-containing protein n=1 Tax=Trichoderma asperellum (strain ATCC 204424 / CBS 433.97 / NBRC 101777) TaxID=1042311 RepID=A0A2T3ZBJ6_TRIA4|nr:hypothetical protein M441DRAFT_78933 [Trichoderma asperellum CBS 433.97]PTB42177.1 hypothetical protein M441DRAFT_78933 [Trichoderma asperellum CBS 433.97]
MANGEINAHEDAPLLGEYEREREPIFPSDDEAAPPIINAARWQVKTRKSIVRTIAIVQCAIIGTGMLLLIPLYRLIEDSVCHVYYGDDSLDLIDEMKCKTDEVQAQMAYLLGWLGLFHSIMSLLSTFPFGMLADKIGRKPTILLASVGMALGPISGPFMLGFFQSTVRKNPYILMISSLALLIGGGIQVVLAMLYAMAADVSSEKEKAASFLQLTFGATVGGLVGPLVNGFLMQKYGPWVPIWVSISCMPFIFLAFGFLPETLPVDRRMKGGDSDLSVELIKRKVGAALVELRKALRLFANPSIPLALLTFLFQAARYTAYTSTILQYVSKHFGWRLAETSFLLSPFGLLNLIVLAVLPRISTLLVSPRFGYSSFKKDLLLTRYSTVLLFIGAIVEGFSHNIVLFIIGLFIETFGAAVSPLARATITHYVDPEHTSTLYALISTTEIFGTFIGGPALAWCFDMGLQKKGLWIGMPWFYIALLCLIAWVGLLFVQPPPAKRSSGNGNGDDELVSSHED